MIEPTKEFRDAWWAACQKDGSWSDAAWEIWQIAQGLSNKQSECKPYPDMTTTEWMEHNAQSSQKSFISDDLPRDRPGIHQNDDGSRTFDYVTTEGDPCKIKLEAGWDGKIVDGVLQVFQTKTPE